MRGFQTVKSWFTNVNSAPSSFIENELELTTRGIAGSMSSVINDFGLNRRTGVNGTHFNAHFGREWSRTSGRSGNKSIYTAPMAVNGQHAVWQKGLTKREMYEAWDKHILESKGLGTTFRRYSYQALGGKYSLANKFLASSGGAGTLFPVGVSLYFASRDAIDGYRKDGIFGAITGAVKGYVTAAITNRIIGGILMNPGRGLIGAGVLLGAGYVGHKVFDVRNEGNARLQMGRMNMTSWRRGPSSSMISANVQAQKHRSITAIENSKYSSVRGMGNEAYMVTSPRSRYAGSTNIGNTYSLIPS
jgi:hypothetical protein